MRLLKPFLPLAMAFSAAVSANSIDPIQLFDDGKLALAQQAFEMRLQKDTNDAKALMYLAWIAQRNEDLDKAEELIERAIKKAPENAEIQYRYGGIIGEVAGDASIFTALGYAEKSLHGLKKAVELEPENIEYQQGLLNFYLIAPGVAGGDTDKALEQAESIQKLDEKSGFLAFSQIFSSLGDKEKLTDLFETALQRFPEDARLYYERGLSNQTQKNFTQAFADFKRSSLLAASEPEAALQRFEAIYQIGRTSVLSEQRVENGIEAILLFIEQAPESKVLPSKEWANYRLANLYELNKQKKEAKTIYRKLYKTTEDSNLKKRVRRKR
jgi:tetratricopeptide (TPR) repeat protein